MVYLVWLAILLAPYWLGPIVVWLTQRVGARPAFEPLVPGRHVVPPDVAQTLRQMCDALAGEGFRVVADLFQGGQVKHVSMRATMLERPDTGELALAVTAFSAAPPARLVTSYVELPTKFRDGRSMTVNNSPRLGVFTPTPQRIVLQLPDVRDPARLCRIKRAYLQRYFGAATTIPFDHQEEPARFLSQAMVRELTEQVAVRTWRRDDATETFRPTFVGAWKMTWRLLPPFRAIRMARLRRRGAALLRELGMEGRDPHPIAQPRSKMSVAWIAALAVAVLIVTRLGSGLVRRLSTLTRSTVALPADFTVPNDFAGAVRALEQLAGSTATPLAGRDSLGDSTVTEGFAVGVPSNRSEALVDAVQSRFLEKGFYLFRAEQHFGIQGRADRVALFPRPDPYEILRLMGTNGANYGIGSDSIVAWLRAVQREQPFILTGIDFDWVEGRFTGVIRDPARLAKWFYTFCPDIVEQGTGNVDALAKELVESQRLYCWWD
ncbi:MAG TPA: DUF4253 domain-containing protein [Gemmatimonadales bacterium]|nr:DUF4253 domain-containing protein [Gemmatimonadales bacterium]